MQTTAKLEPLSNPLTIVLVSPRIPPNTGNIARLCACTGLKLVLVEPLGFSIDDKALKRAGLDYWNNVFLRLYPSWEAYLREGGAQRRFLFTARAGTSLWHVRFAQGDHLVFGAETTGLASEVLESGQGTLVNVPMLDERRSLNLSTVAGVVAYEALRQLCG